VVLAAHLIEGIAKQLQKFGIGVKDHPRHVEFDNGVGSVERAYHSFAVTNVPTEQ
jgi:hypothetical protein